MTRRSMREASRSRSGDGYTGVFSLRDFIEFRMHFSVCMLHFNFSKFKNLKALSTKRMIGTFSHMQIFLNYLKICIRKYSRF